MIPNTNHNKLLLEWYNTPSGLALFKTEVKGLQTALTTLFGYYLLQIGYPLDPTLLKNCRIHQNVFLDSVLPEKNYNNFIQARPTALPFISQSVDAIIIFHLLEFINEPKKFLEEVYQTLIPGGIVIIFGFNPHSLMGISRWAKPQPKFPWNAALLNPVQVRKLLTKTNFEVGDYQTFYFRPLTNNTSLLKKMLFLESIGSMFLPYCGASYMFIARKTCARVKLIRPTLHTKEALLPNTQIARYDKNF